MSSVCGGNQVRGTKTSVSCLQSSMVVGVSWSGAAWVLHCWNWGATVHWGNDECQHVLWHTEAEHDYIYVFSRCLYPKWLSCIDSGYNFFFQYMWCLGIEPTTICAANATALPLSHRNIDPPPFGDWATGQYSNMITTTALLKKLRVKVMD